MKHILDSVHGNIMVGDEYFSIIDTKEFQRLRRVEQTAIRSVFPSARHDRFIHSLGVFHVGNMIVNHFRANKEEEYKLWNINENEIEKIYKSYLVACLLHDVGHAPFSHTFEEYYGKKTELSIKLTELISDKEFTQDVQVCVDDVKCHEYVSAYVTYRKFKDTIEKMDVDPIFVVRMIIGCFYSNKNVDANQLRNCFVSLLHGDLVDADRLDYACRDIWASGYSTCAIDLSRIINALHIRKTKDGQDFVVCFNCNVVNEIENLMVVKDFQMKYVLNHHTVIYDQWLLQSAVEHTAKEILRETGKNDDNGENVNEAMEKLCSLESMVEEKEFGRYVLQIPSDDDFIFMMKQDNTNELFKEWISRKYLFYPVWKSPEEFAHFFGIKKGVDMGGSAICDKIKEVLLNDGYKENDILILKAVFKPKVKLSSLYVLVHKNVKRFTEIYEENNELSTDKSFYYLYIKNYGNKRRKKIAELLRNEIKKYYLN